jgi:predicted 3-demethylubiquinone-9 3-methyltransferase (glyoxalase superfamily)
MKPKNTICLWFDKDAQEAARFYAVTFPDSKVTTVHKDPGDYPGAKKGDELTVEFTVLGIPCLGLNGGPAFRHTEARVSQLVANSVRLASAAVKHHALYLSDAVLAPRADSPFEV